MAIKSRSARSTAIARPTVACQIKGAFNSKLFSSRTGCAVAAVVSAMVVGALTGCCCRSMRAIVVWTTVEASAVLLRVVATEWWCSDEQSTIDRWIE